MTVFIDTSGWVSLFNSRDSNHRLAKVIWSNLIKARSTLLTSDFILDETITLLRVRAGFEVSIRAGESIFSSRILERAMVDERTIYAAWSIYKKYRDQNLSFTDCTSFFVMKERGIREAFSFDSHFEWMGFTLLK